MKIAIVGLGLMGGSLALALKKHKLASHIFGIDVNSENADYALENKIVEELTDLKSAIANSDLVFLATNMGQLQKLLVQVLDEIKNNTLVIDLGSTKYELAKCVENHEKRANYLAAHPIAGTEFSGPQNAFAELYENKMMIFCDTNKSANSALEKAKHIFHTIGMKVVEMGSEEHDKHIAYVSHLSHIISFSLGATVLEKEKDHKNIFTMAGSGFASTVRLAKSSPKMWTPIIEHNKKNILEAITAFQKELEGLKNTLEEEKWGELEQYLSDTNEIKKILN